MKEKMDKLTCEEIFAEVDKHMTTALMFHSQMFDYFNFLGLCGFKKLHEYQYYDESIGKKRLHKTYIKQYNKLIEPTCHDKVDVIPNEWYKHTRMDIDDGVLAKYVRKAWKEYLEWEEQTKCLYECVCCIFLERGELTKHDVIKHYLDDVVCELTEIYKVQECLNNVGFDVVYIMEMQENIYKQYKKKMESLEG